jgi:hypothetical protein
LIPFFVPSRFSPRFSILSFRSVKIGQEKQKDTDEVDGRNIDPIVRIIPNGQIKLNREDDYCGSGKEKWKLFIKIQVLESFIQKRK